jgi:DNA-binding HxlR family transcriptional regulator
MKSTSQKRSSCPINFALEEFGDIWSLLIVRDMMLSAKTTYNEFLSSEERIATNILANRLEKLLANGIITKTPHSSDKRKEIYQLTQKGIDLYPILREMMLWSATYDPETELTKDLVRTLQEESQRDVIKKFQQASASS